MDELRKALKTIDRELFAQNCHGPLRDAVSDLSEYLLKLHARLDRMSTEISRLVKRGGPT